jgi:hypothetical protein
LVAPCKSRPSLKLTGHREAQLAPPVNPAGFALPSAIDHNATNVNFAPGSS